MGRYKPEITDEQWKRIEPLLPKLKVGRKGGHPWAENRPVFEGIVWILRTGSPWNALPKEYPAPSTCWRRLRAWEEAGVWENAWREYLRQLDDVGVLRWEECFIDASFFAAKRGASESDQLVKGKVRSSWWWQAATVYRSESTLRLRRLARRLSQKKRSEMYASLDQDPDVLNKFLDAL